MGTVRAAKGRKKARPPARGNRRASDPLKRALAERDQALRFQAATGEILASMRSSVTDAQPVFGAIVDNVLRLFGTRYAAVFLVRDDNLELAAARADADFERRQSSAFLKFRESFPQRVDYGGFTGKALRSGQIMQMVPVVGNPEATPQAVALAQSFGYDSLVVAPLMREGKAIGVIGTTRPEARRFDEEELALLRAFADQAVIAIQNARLFREIQEKSAQLEVANKHKSDFLANMSHELRTPLNAIIGFSEVLMERMFGEVNDKQADYLKDIHESGRHLLSLINDILDLSKIEAGRMELELSSFHLPTALSNAMTLVRERAQRHGIELRLEVDPRLGEFEGDERKVKQILLNLLSNAVKFTPDGGRVDVTARSIDSRVEIAVKDNGVGIAPEDQASLFEEFRQVGSDATRKAEGTGLGLALTKRFVELHGGEIRVESAPGQGATFTVLLPVP